jgi:hypothetical protein
MKNFSSWRKEQTGEDHNLQEVTRDEFLQICRNYFGATIRGSMKTFSEHQNENLIEATETSRYAVEVNYRTKANEALEGFAKICLGYVSAAMKKMGYHTKHVFTEKPLRLLIASRNWDDGEWVGVVTWHHDHKCFVLSKGFYNRDRKTVSLQNSTKCSGESAAEITRELTNTMHHLKDQPDRQVEKLKPVPLKRGPKR